jgi:hypothetical protein
MFRILTTFYFWELRCPAHFDVTDSELYFKTVPNCLYWSFTLTRVVPTRLCLEDRRQARYSLTILLPVILSFLKPEVRSTIMVIGSLILSHPSSLSIYGGPICLAFFRAKLTSNLCLAHGLRSLSAFSIFSTASSIFLKLQDS